MRFTPLVAAVTIRLDHRTNRMAPSTVPAKARFSHGMSRTREIWVDAGVSPAEFGNCSARTAKMMPTAAWRISLALAFSPRLRCLEILMKSSRKPTSPMPTMRNNSSSPEARRPRGMRVHHPHDQVGEQVADDDRQDHHGAAHRGRAALGVVGGGSVVPDELSVALADQEPDEQRGAREREEQRHSGAHQQCNHSCALPSVAVAAGPSAGRSGEVLGACGGNAIRSPRWRSPMPFEDLNRTRSPGRSSAWSSS